MDIKFSAKILNQTLPAITLTRYVQNIEVQILFIVMEDVSPKTEDGRRKTGRRKIVYLRLTQHAF